MTFFSKKTMPREAIGLLGGIKQNNNELLISKMVFVTEGDEVSVAFSEDDFKKFEEILNDDLYVVGWWHSHPGYGLFLSNTDIETHIYSFQLHNKYSVALVIEPTEDPINEISPFNVYQVVGEEGKTKFSYIELTTYIKQDI